MKLIKENILPIIINALKEDIGAGDITTSLLFDKDINVAAVIVAKEECVLVGMDVAKWVFDAIDEKLDFKGFAEDRAQLKKRQKVCSIKGSIRSILSSERVVLNFLGHLSGIATLTAKFVEEARGTKAKIFDTRKTTPGLRELEKYAVKVGGGYNHRMGLWDGILIKDNHLIGLKSNLEKLTALQVLKDVVMNAKIKGYKNIEIEISNLNEFKEIEGMEPDVIMLDNMKIEDIKKIVKLNNSKPKASDSKRPILEVSGGVTLDNVRSIAKTGVDRISIGRLTHSTPSVDFSLEICQ